MSDTALQTQYRQEYVKGFEQHESLVRSTVTTEVQVKGDKCIFLVADSGGATAVTRGLNGRIPGRPDNLNQYTVQLSEWHDKVEKTRFNIFTSQGDQRAIMQMSSMGVMNRKIDSQIITELNTATNDTGTATAASLRMVTTSTTILGNNYVPIMDGQVTGLITPAFLADLMETKEFANANYVSKKPLDGAPNPYWKDVQGYYQWMGINWVVHPSLPGAGTAAEKCFLYHRSAIGHAAPGELIDTAAGYNEEDDFSFFRTSSFIGAKLLQNAGVVVMNHDGSNRVAQ